MNKTAPWQAADQIVAKFNPEAGQEEIASYFEHVKTYLDQCDVGEKFGEWLASWNAIQKTGVLYELSEKTGISFKAVCEQFGCSYDYEQKKSSVYRLMRKYNRLAMTSVNISLWVKWAPQLSVFLESNPAEASFWGGEKLIIAPFGYVTFQWYNQQRQQGKGKEMDEEH